MSEKSTLPIWFDDSPKHAESWLEKLLSRFISRMEQGHLRLAVPGGRIFTARGTTAALPEAHMQINRWRAVLRVITAGDLGFADGYIDNDWTSDDLPALIELAARNRRPIGGTIRPSLLGRTIARIGHVLRSNTPSGSRRNIMAHYDLGNDFYAQWLDRGMSYSSALYQREDQSLEQAQQAKQQRILALLGADAGMRVLEIGCGWGGLAGMMAERGLEVTGLTLSSAQLDYARTHAPKVDVRLQDYRDARGTFDRIVSIEMVEAVGERFWPAYFAQLKNLLAPAGKIVLQAITIDEGLFDGYRRDVDFIQRSVFPGGMLLTKGLIERHLRDAGLRLCGMEHFGDSYARTLAEWRRRFLEAWPAIEAMGFPARFKRLWDYYLAYCEGGFRARSIDVGFYQAEHG